LKKYAKIVQENKKKVRGIKNGKNMYGEKKLLGKKIREKKYGKKIMGKKKYGGKKVRKKSTGKQVRKKSTGEKSRDFRSCHFRLLPIAPPQIIICPSPYTTGL
jgi:hypothetical protein